MMNQNEIAENPAWRSPRPAGAPSEGVNGIRAWLAVLDSVLIAIEKTAWEARAVADQALEAWRALESGTSEAIEQCREVADEARRWPARLKRLSATGWGLTRIATSYRLWGIRSAFLPRRRIPAALDVLHAKNAQRFYRLSVEQGGAFLKVGQLLSTRPDVLPSAWVRELAGLQDQVPAESFEAVRAIIETDLGAPLEDLFEVFDAAPIAAASIGQVHRAIDRNGQSVAVKVQRPGIAERVELDMVLLRLFLTSMEGILPPTDYQTIAGEIETMVREELDYEAEARAMQQMADFFEGAPGVIVPRPIPELCGSRVLSSNFIEGRKITAVLDELQKSGESKRLSTVLGGLLELYLKQVLDGGVFQADPHPGNLLVTDKDELVLLDFGCTKRLPERFRTGYFELVQAFFTHDNVRLAGILAELGFATRSGNPETLIAFAEIMLDQLRKASLSAGEFRWPDKNELIEQATEVLQHAMNDPVEQIPSEFVMLARVFGSLGGLFVHYQPQLDFPRYVLPYLTPRN